MDPSWEIPFNPEMIPGDMFTDTDIMFRDGFAPRNRDKNALKAEIRNRYPNTTFLNENEPTILLGHVLRPDDVSAPVVLNTGRILVRAGVVDNVEVFIRAQADILNYMRTAPKINTYKPNLNPLFGGVSISSNSSSSSSSSSSGGGGCGSKKVSKLKKFGTLYNPRTKRCGIVYENTRTGDLYKYVSGRGERKLHKLKHTEIERVVEGKMSKRKCDNMKKEYYKDKPGCNGALTCKKYGIMYKQDSKKCAFVYRNPSGDLYKIVKNAGGKRKYRKLTPKEIERVVRGKEITKTNCKRSKRAGGFAFNFGCGCGVDAPI